MGAPVYDVIVAGTGSMGAAAAYQLASQGYRVLALEQFDTVPHEEGSHGGQSRIIRKAYFEHTDYIPLLERAYSNWRQLEQQCSEQLYYPTGLLYGGLPDHPVLRGVQDAANRYAIPLEKKRADEIPDAFTRPDGYTWILEPEAGFLLPEKIISLYIRQARACGATIRTGVNVLGWEHNQEGIRVHTGSGSFYCHKLIITAGAWTAKLLRQAQVPLKITRQLIFWVQPEEVFPYTPGQFPCWLVTPAHTAGAWYGFPYLSGEKFPGPAGMKFALHHPGDETDPSRVNREVREEEIQPLIREAAQYFRLAGHKRVTVKTCLYSNTPDEHFIIDQLPGEDGKVIIAAGFSGHGFKFVSVVGEILADLATTGKTAWPVGFLGLNRFT